MRIVIVDDEVPARARLRRLLLAHPDVNVVGEASDGEQALQQAIDLTPDALLLDIQMPGVSGLDVAASLSEPAPAVVFVTAFDQFALQAFDAAAVDYLLKPIEPERLARALQRLRDRQGFALAPSDPPSLALSYPPSNAPSNWPSRPPPTRLLIPDRGRSHVIAVADIQWLEAADNYVVVHTATQAPLMRRTLAGLLHDLGSGFVRTHRSFAVALSQVAHLQTHGRGDSVVVLRDGRELACSRQHRAALHARLSSLR